MFQCDQFASSLVLGDCSCASDEKLGFKEKYSNFVDFEFINQLYELQPVYIAFYLMPLMHSENLDQHKRNLRLYKYLIDRLSNDCLKSKENEAKYKHWVEYFQYSLPYAEEHKQDIELFGRFPHRNDLLNREWTQAERDYVKEKGRMELITGKQEEEKDDK